MKTQRECFEALAARKGVRHTRTGVVVQFAEDGVLKTQEGEAVPWSFSNDAKLWEVYEEEPKLKSDEVVLPEAVVVQNP